MIKESEIQESILHFLNFQKVYCRENKSVWFYDTKNWFFRKNKSPYYKNGVSDILWILDGRFLAIEVKTPSEYKMSQKSIFELQKRMKKLKPSTQKKYKHFIEQQEFIQNINNKGGIWFFADSVERVIEEFEKFNFVITK